MEPTHGEIESNRNQRVADAPTDPAGSLGDLGAGEQPLDLAVRGSTPSGMGDVDVVRLFGSADVAAGLSLAAVFDDCFVEQLLLVRLAPPVGRQERVDADADAVVVRVVRRLLYGVQELRVQVGDRRQLGVVGRKARLPSGTTAMSMR